MSFSSRLRAVLVVAVVGLFTFSTAHRLTAQDVVHVVKGVVKSVDKDSKTLVVKASDGTEHTIKWTDKTSVDGGKEIGKDIGEGSKVSVRYTKKAGEETAVGVKDAGKATAKAVQ